LDMIGLVIVNRTFGMCDRLLYEATAGGNTLSPSSSSQSSSQSSTTAPLFLSSLNVLVQESLRQVVFPEVFLRGFPAGTDVQNARAVTDAFLQDCINQRLQERQKNDHSTSQATTTDLLNILLDAQAAGTISSDDVKGHLLTFLFAGHDTTAHTLTWMLYEIARHPALQEELYREAAKAIPDRNGFYDSKKDTAGGNALRLHEAVWKETLRLYPGAATGTQRQVGSRPIVAGNIELPAGAMISIPPYTLHRNEQYWGPDATVFDPYRFLLNERDPHTDHDHHNDAHELHAPKRDPLTFQPFSAGPRNCMGSRLARAESLFFASALMRRFRVSTTPDTVHPPAEFLHLTLRPQYGIQFQFEKRS